MFENFMRIITHPILSYRIGKVTRNVYGRMRETEKRRQGIKEGSLFGSPKHTASHILAYCNNISEPETVGEAEHIMASLAEELASLDMEIYKRELHLEKVRQIHRKLSHDSAIIAPKHSSGWNED